MYLHAAKVREVQVVESRIPVVNEKQRIDLSVSWRHAIQEIETSADYIPAVQQIQLNAPRVAEVVRVDILGMHEDEVQSFVVGDTFVSETQAVRLCKDTEFSVLRGTFQLTLSETISVDIDVSAADLKSKLESMQFMGAGSLASGTFLCTLQYKR